MELTNPINNEDMVEGLNRIICASKKVCGDCKHIRDKAEQESTADTLRSLEQMHADHIEMLSDSVRYLGGAPFSGDPDGGLLSANKHATSINDLCQQERELLSSCDKESKNLAGSDEVVEKLNRVKDDISAQLERLKK